MKVHHTMSEKSLEGEVEFLTVTKLKRNWTAPSEAELVSGEDPNNLNRVPIRSKSGVILTR